MGLGIGKLIREISSSLNVIRFAIRKAVFGFEHANLMLGVTDKKSVLKILRANGAVIGNGCDIETGLTFHNCTDYSRLTVGDNAHIGKNCFIDLAGRVNIGNNSVVSMKTSFLTHINIHRSKLEELYPSSVSDIIIGEDTYIGAGSMILMGVNLGHECFVAAGSVVNKSFGPGSFIAGSPAVFKKSLLKQSENK